MQHSDTMKARFVVATVLPILLATCTADADTVQDRISLEADKLWDAFEDRDLRAFDAVLDRGVLDTSAFERHEVHYTLCEATREGNEPFLRSVLEHGVDPDVQNPTPSALDRNALACAATRYNIEAFDILLEAGASTEPSLCNGCGRNRTLFTIVANMPPFASRILERRRLTQFEAEYLAWQVEHISLANSYEGQPTYEWYQNLLRTEYGIDNLTPFNQRE